MPGAELHLPGGSRAGVHHLALSPLHIQTDGCQAHDGCSKAAWSDQHMQSSRIPYAMSLVDMYQAEQSRIICAMPLADMHQAGMPLCSHQAHTALMSPSTFTLVGGAGVMILKEGARYCLQGAQQGWNGQKGHQALDCTDSGDRAQAAQPCSQACALSLQMRLHVAVRACQQQCKLNLGLRARVGWRTHACAVRSYV